MIDIHAALQVFSLLGCLAVLVRLIQSKLSRTYPLFGSYLLLTLTLQTVAVLYGTCSPQLCRAYLLLEPVRNLGYLLAIWELVSVSFKGRIELHGLRPPAIVIGGIAFAGLAMMLCAPNSHILRGPLLSIAKLERGITFSLAALALLTLSFASRHAIKLSRNSVTLFAFWIVWFLGDSAILLSASLVPATHLAAVNDGLALLEVGSYMGWALLLCSAEVNEGFGDPTVPAAISA